MRRWLLLFVVLVPTCARAGLFSSDDQPGYDRSKFPTWTAQGQVNLANGATCTLDTRTRLLANAGSRVQAARADDGSCRITAGEWKDYFTGNILTDASGIDIDHLVPLKEAWNSGAFQWTTDQRQQFANSLATLDITTSSANRKKGDKGIADWLPEDKHEACGYIFAYVGVKLSYHLTFTKDEVGVIKDFHKSTVKDAQGVKSECTLYNAFDKGLVFGDSLKALPIRE